ncbi:hypothetical protein FE257_008317 [Aspergillus nanangensis]|uniref:Uncharacterized protein n=1 Tax=Aspergillus nanangensis TaxID=2582783 RepID=A0AAD4CLW6_ASPNN|nr:hypothetical protein FE257_008317 [Aspergillus nanangensis]
MPKGWFPWAKDSDNHSRCVWISVPVATDLESAQERHLSALHRLRRGEKFEISLCEIVATPKFPVVVIRVEVPEEDWLGYTVCRGLAIQWLEGKMMHNRCR